MKEFNDFIQTWGVGILLLTIYARLRHGGKNIDKYKRYDAWKKKRKKIRGY